MKIKQVFSAGFISLLVFVSITSGGELRVGVGEIYTTIQSAIDMAVDGDVVVVGDGVYTCEGNCDINFNGKAITVRSTDPSDASVVERTVILNTTEGSFSVKFENDEGRESILEGLTFKGIRISVSSSSPTIKNCVIQDSFSIGVAVYSGSPLIENCKIADCLSHGLHCVNCDAIIRNCHIVDNQGVNDGGGINVVGPGGTVLVDNCLIESNSASRYGGGIGCFNDGGVRVTNSVIRGNSVESGGGGSGICCRGDRSSFVANCIIENNSVSSGAYGVDTIVNCLIAGNAGGVTCGKAINCTIVGNSNGGIYSWGGIVNCIIWGNTTDEESLEDQQITLAGKGYVENSCVSGWTGKYGGVGNFGGNPLFIDFDGGDYRLQSDSPCVDTGKTVALDVQALTDLDGNGRVKDGDGDLVAVVDIGAFEIPSTAVGPLMGSLQEDFFFEAFEARQNPAAQTLTIVNGGVGVINWSVSEPCGWLDVTPDSGEVEDTEAETATVTVDITGLDMGDHACDIVISDPSSVNSPLTIPVSLHITGPIFSLSSDSFDIYAEQGGVDPDAVTLTIENVGGGDLNWSANADCDWVDVSAGTNIVGEEPVDISIQAHVGDFGIGIYTCQISFSDPRAENNTQVVTLRLHVRGQIINVPEDTTDLGVAVDLVPDGGMIIVQDGTYFDEQGLGFKIVDKNVIIKSVNGSSKCIIDCSEGKGFRFEGSGGRNVVIEGLTIANAPGPGIACFGNNTFSIRDCIITNCAKGINCSDGSINISDCQILQNRKTGIFIQSETTPRISNCYIRGNSESGVELHTSGAFLNNCLIVSNWEDGIKYWRLGGTPDDKCIITHCTLAKNNRGVITENSGCIIENSILWNHGSEIWGHGYYASEGIVVGNSFVRMGYDGDNVFESDPQLTLDGHLLSTSPCIDAGVELSSDPGEFDVDGDARFYGTACDAGGDEFVDSDGDGIPNHWERRYFGSDTGAKPDEDSDKDRLTNMSEYESTSNPLSTIYYVDASMPDDSGDGLSWESAKKTIQGGIDEAVDHDAVFVANGFYDISDSSLTFGGKTIALRSLNGPDFCTLSVATLDIDSTVGDGYILDGFSILGTDPDRAVITTHFEGIPTFENCDISGGKYGIEIYGAGAIVRNCTIRDNTEDGIYMLGEDNKSHMLCVENCEIHHNGGHGILACDGKTTFPSVTIYDCNIHHNGGAGVWSWAIFDVDRCRFEGNGSCGFGISSPDMVLRNSVIVGNCWNNSWLPGLGVSSAGNSMKRLLIENCTIADNVGDGGIMGFSQGAEPFDRLVNNCIVWGNRIDDSDTGQIFIKPDVGYVVTNSNIQGGWEGEGNIDEEPYFADPSAMPYWSQAVWVEGDYRLSSLSPCINAGDADYAVDENETDLDGRQRVLGGRIDMGAYENSSANLVADEEINLGDLMLFASRWLEQGCEDPSWCGGADLTFDGSVDGDDLAKLGGEWLQDTFGPIAWWRFDETSGNFASDSSLSRHSGKLTKSDDSAWVDGKIGNALSLDGVDDYVWVYWYRGIGGGASRTVTAWIKTTDRSGDIIAWGTAMPGGRWNLVTESGGRLRLEVGGGAIVGSTSICDNQWHHVAVVGEDDGSPNINEVRLYVDGVLDVPSFNGSDREVNTVLEGDVRIGVWDGRFFKGLLDDVRIYDRALSVVEVEGLAGVD